jgi:hypothetical protein
MTYVDEMVQKEVQEKSRVDGIFDLLWQDWPDLQSDANKAVLVSYHERVKVPITLQSLKESIQFLLSSENLTGFRLIEPKSAEEVAQYEAAEAERAKEAEAAERERLLSEIEKRLKAKGADVEERMKQYRIGRNNAELAQILFNLDETARLRGMSRDQLRQEMKGNVLGRDPYASGTFPELPITWTNENLRNLAKSNYPAFKRLQQEYGLDQLDARMGNHSKDRIQPGTTMPLAAAPKNQSTLGAANQDLARRANYGQKGQFTLPKEIDGIPLDAAYLLKHPQEIRRLVRLAGRGNSQAGFAAVTRRLRNED